MRLLAQVKKTFFDRKVVIDAMDRATRNVLSKFGAFVRTRAKSSIRQRKQASEPGKPPSSHVGTLKDFIYFGYEADRQAVVIGPTKTDQVFFDNDRRPVTGTVPEVLEYGGQITILDVFKYGSWQRLDLRSRRRATGLPTRMRTVAIKARPYMNPAFEIEKRQLPGLWADSMVKQAA